MGDALGTGKSQVHTSYTVYPILNTGLPRTVSLYTIHDVIVDAKSMLREMKQIGERGPSKENAGAILRALSVMS